MMKLNAGLLVLSLLAIAGCAGGKAGGVIVQSAPEWVNQGSGKFAEGIYGVGLAQGIRNRALAVTAADDRARAEVAKVLSSYVKELSERNPEAIEGLKNALRNEAVKKYRKRT